MTANELMIGDWVFNAHNRKPEQVAKIGCRLVMLDYNDMYEYDLIEPIPLTPEILEKNGWKKAAFNGGYGRKGMRLDGYNGNELPEGVENALSFAQWSIDEHFQYHLLEIYMWKGSVHLWVHYVHELQHALRLCGIEKEIEL